jgi:hypothetical protein
MATFIRRRQFIAAVSGMWATWPLAARAQSGRVRRIGALMWQAEDDPDRGVRVAAFAQGLQQLGWTIGGIGRAQAGCSFCHVGRDRRRATVSKMAAERHVQVTCEYRQRSTQGSG